MAGIKLLTKLDPKTCIKVAFRAEQDLGFTLTPYHECALNFTASKGSLLKSVFAGALSPHCVFQISASAYSDANELVLERNQPWILTGSSGNAKVKQQADDLMQAIACAIEKEGASILERKEF